MSVVAQSLLDPDLFDIIVNDVADGTECLQEVCR